MPDFWEVLKRRHSVRDFDESRGVTDEQIKKILEAAEMAPSAGAMRDWRFSIVRHKDIKERLAKAALGQMFISEAPVVIVVSSDLSVAQSYYGKRGSELYAIQDTAAACENLLLAVTALGLGACWVGAFYEEEVKKILDLPKSWQPMAIIPIGVPKQRISLFS